MYLREPLLLVVLYMVMVNNYHADFCGLAFTISTRPLETHLTQITQTHAQPQTNTATKTGKPQTSSGHSETEHPRSDPG